jgi:hypothetical protein
MARGWESKSVEAQQAEAGEKSGKTRAKLTPEQAANQREKVGLTLSRARILQQIEASRDPRHRQILEQALAELDAKLRALGAS